MCVYSPFPATSHCVASLDSLDLPLMSVNYSENHSNYRSHRSDKQDNEDIP